MVDYGFSISPGEEAFVGVSPVGIHSDDDIKAISMDKRGCYATGERRLAFYHHYSLLNCYMECVSNYTDDVRKRATKYEIHKIVLDFCCPLPLVCIETEL